MVIPLWTAGRPDKWNAAHALINMRRARVLPMDGRTIGMQRSLLSLVLISVLLAVMTVFS